MNIQDKPFLPIGGLSTDTEPVNQPDGTTRFALNAIYDAESGAQGSINNEHSNQLCVNLDGKIIGTINADRVNLIVFTSNNTIWIVDTDKCEASLIISLPEFNFGDIITGTYRVIKGCERVIYWRDGVNPDRQLNIDKIDDYQDLNDFSVTPEFYPANVELTVRDSGGRLEYGTYFFILQYTDSQGNVAAKTIPYGPVYITDGLNIENYLPDVGGLPISNKSIRLDITNIDARYEAIKIGVVRYTSSDGVTPNAHEVGDIIEINNNSTTYYYRGFNPNNGDTLTTQSSLLIPGTYYESSKVMRQVQGRLLRANVIEKNVDYSTFQQYASKINSEFITTDVGIDETFTDVVKTEIGDEIKAYGIVYVFDTGQISPVFHIPGNYTIKDTSYINPTNYCGDDYWGLDAKGNKLLNTGIRQHKVPSRSEIPILATERVTVSVQADRYYQLVPCSNEPVSMWTERKPTLYHERVNIADTNALSQVGVSTAVQWIYSGLTTNSDNPGIIPISILSTNYSDCTGTKQVPLPTEGYGTTYRDGDLAVRYIGVKFSNIEYPKNSGIVGHYFVTNIRTEGTKTVLQNGIAFPHNDGKDIDRGKYIHYSNGSDIKRFTASQYQNIISPDYLFNDTASRGNYIQYYGTFTTAFHEYTVTGKERQEVTSVNPGEFTELTDGAELSFNKVIYFGKHHFINGYNTGQPSAFGIEDTYSLTPSTAFKGIANKSLSSKFYIVKLDRVLDQVYFNANTSNAHYIAIKSEVPVLTNLNTITYRLMHTDLGKENESMSLFSGDAYITPLSLTNMTAFYIQKQDDDPRLEYEWIANIYVESEINSNLKFSGTEVCNQILDYQLEYEDLSSRFDRVVNDVTVKWWDNTDFIDFKYSTDNDNKFDIHPELLKFLLNRIAINTDFTKLEYELRGQLCQEFYGYNQDWSINSSTRYFRSLGYYFDYCSNCSNKYPNRIIWSEVSREEDLQDMYRLFKPLSYFDIPADKGAITSLDYVDNVILVRTEQSSFILQPNPQQLQASGTLIALGTGDFLSLPAQELISVPTGHGGQQDVLAEVNTKFGLVWVDTKEGKVFLKPTGGGFEEISSYKMYHWFERNLSDGETYLTYDPRFERLILHYKEIKGEVNKGFTISYNFRTKSWISFHSYQPDIMTYTNSTFFTGYNNKLYSHDNYSKFTNYFGIDFPFIIEGVDTNMQTFNPHSIAYYAQVQYYDELNNEWIPVNKTFDQLVAYNKLQSTGLVNLEIKDQLRALSWSNKTKPVSIKDKNSRVSQIRDIAIASPVMTNEWNYVKDYYVNEQGYIDKVPLPTSIDYNKQQLQLNEFSDKYVQIRLIFNDNSHKITIHLLDVNKFASLR